ncbi:hypothetical protein AUK40_02550 [Candidatus Wirthbacteria bacterium CG2_30_54_11]|uniref:Nudix hydrolase domain-containing protein n=1 Tax=Candidatus Wirthbacteria bacterium CG2_30_54_11 TaxID=1817892 RepID=A0A1J5IM59_9BACT|nr:MAG: hypothetical protein AUK40_02550 [Candidatus Wirthbacteria bacterium CG2_30_54_11]
MTEKKATVKGKPEVSLEHSAGGIVYKRAGDLILIAITYRDYHKDWTLPKGHLEEGETAEQAALREVREETGIIARIVTHIGSSTYRFRDKKAKKLIEKLVDYFLMEMVEDSGVIQLEEIDEVAWLPFIEAIHRLSFPRDRDLVQQAVARIPR